MLKILYGDAVYAPKFFYRGEALLLYVHQILTGGPSRWVDRQMDDFFFGGCFTLRRMIASRGPRIKCARVDVDKERLHRQMNSVVNASVLICEPSSERASKWRGRRKYINAGCDRSSCICNLRSTSIARCASISVRRSANSTGERAEEINGLAGASSRLGNSCYPTRII